MYLLLWFAFTTRKVRYCDIVYQLYYSLLSFFDFKLSFFSSLLFPPISLFLVRVRACVWIPWYIFTNYYEHQSLTILSHTSSLHSYSSFHFHVHPSLAWKQWFLVSLLFCVFLSSVQKMKLKILVIWNSMQSAIIIVPCLHLMKSKAMEALDGAKLFILHPN